MASVARREFFQGVLLALRKAGIPFMVGGAFAMAYYAGVRRQTKDLDLFIHPRDTQAVVDLFTALGYPTTMPAPHWLIKVVSGEETVDFVHGSSNGVCVVDDAWFTHAVDGTALDLPVKMVALEEMVWSKGFVMARGRFDGPDIVHLLRSRGQDIDWRRLLDRFGEHWPVLFSHLVLFAYIYPSDRHIIPDWVDRELTRRWHAKQGVDAPTRLCRGTLLSDQEYQVDILEWGYVDARLEPLARLARKAPPEAA